DPVITGWMDEHAPVFTGIVSRLADRLLDPFDRGRVKDIGLLAIPRNGANILGANFSVLHDFGTQTSYHIYVSPFSSDALRVSTGYRGMETGGQDAYGLASQMVLTAIHEIAHVRVHSEGDPLWDEMDRMRGRV